MTERCTAAALALLLAACAAPGPAPGAAAPGGAEDHAAYYLSRPHRRFDCRECHAQGWGLEGVRCLPCHQDEVVIHHRDNPPCARCHFTDHWENLYR
ncbi:MAG: hypothetical protein D6739_02165 [Nitrospirae bacterium]|nr:MAG: hypothetical protein D6739_02165 [Nitrospirota bacterium]